MHNSKTCKVFCHITADFLIAQFKLQLMILPDGVCRLPLDNDSFDGGFGSEDYDDIDDLMDA
jgi:hypothetical protein